MVFNHKYLACKMKHLSDSLTSDNQIKVLWEKIEIKKLTTAVNKFSNLKLAKKRKF